MPHLSQIYRRRKPQNFQYYQCVEDHFERFEQVYDDLFARQYGFLRTYVKQVIYRYLDCGILHNGFAHVRCGGCGHEDLLAFSCKRRHFFPSCHQKRVVEFGEWLCEEVLKAVPHRHFIFSIPKILRRYTFSMIENSSPNSAGVPGTRSRCFSRQLCLKRIRFQEPLLPFRALGTFLDSIPTFTFSVRMAAFMERVCSE